MKTTTIKSVIHIKSITRILCISTLICSASHHNLTHSAAEHLLQERLLQNNPDREELLRNNPDTDAQEMLDQQLVFACYTGDLEKAQQALESGANPNAISKQSSCNRTTHCLLNFPHGIEPEADSLLSTLFTSLCATWTVISSYACIKSSISHNSRAHNNTLLNHTLNAELSEAFCVSSTVIPTLIGSYFLARSIHHYNKKTPNTNSWKNNVLYTIDDKTPLIIAAEQQRNLKQSYLQIIDLLLQYNADMHSTDKEGNTPLMFAVTNGNTNTIETLCLAGANARQPNIYGSTPLNSASREINMLIKTIEHAHNFRPKLTTILTDQQLPNPITDIIIDYALSYYYSPNNSPHYNTPEEQYIIKLINTKKIAPHKGTRRTATVISKHSPRQPQASFEISSPAAAIDYRALSYDDTSDHEITIQDE